MALTAAIVAVGAVAHCAPAAERETPAPVVAQPVVGDAPARFVGSAACASCHAGEHAAWRASNHHRAMEPARDDTVRGDFRDVSFEYFGRTTRFFKNGDAFLVATENEQGAQQTFTVAYTLGIEPLQQYLVAFDGGRIQALPFAWDSRPAEAGGQRWFHLYPNEDVTPESPLFWTRAQQNWNHMCGECHTTDFDKGFSSGEGEPRWNTRFSELGNGCESCHGAGSEHAQAPERALLGLHEQTAQLDQCGVCHARRVRLSAPIEGRERMHDTWRPELVQDGLYFVDGQIRDEVFEIGSFLQSKMAGHGVKCTACHDPHSAQLKAQDNTLCTQCHDRRYDSEHHHFHATATEGARCVNCHMPTRTYMVVDDRRDHRIAVPRPDLSDALGTPNACVRCHDGKSNRWAADAIDRHRGSDHAPALATLGTVVARVQSEQPDAVTQVRAWLAERAASPIAKASALVALGSHPSNEARALIESQVSEPDPWLRLGAALGSGRSPVPVQAPALNAFANDASRAVRLAIAPLVARDSQHAGLLAEYQRWLAIDGDRADALVKLANVQSATGERDAARASLETALRRDETSLLAHLNLADHHRATRDDAGAEALLRKAVALYPESADAHFALGLLLVRQKQPELAVVELERAVQLAPANSHYAYVLAVGLHSTQQVERALSTLRAAAQRFPANTEIRSALRAYCGGELPDRLRASCGEPDSGR